MSCKKKCTFCRNIDKVLECESWNELGNLCIPLVFNSGCKSESCREFQKKYRFLSIDSDLSVCLAILIQCQFWGSETLISFFTSLEESESQRDKSYNDFSKVPQEYLRCEDQDYGKFEIDPNSKIQIVHHFGMYLMCVYLRKTKFHLSVPTCMAF